MIANEAALKDSCKQFAETAKSREAFDVYLRLGPNRSHAKVAQRLRKKGLKRIAEWSSKYEWVERAAQWDADQRRIQEEQMITQAEQMAKRHAEIEQQMFNVLAELPTKMLGRIDKIVDGPTVGAIEYPNGKRYIRPAMVGKETLAFVSALQKLLEVKDSLFARQQESSEVIEEFVITDWKPKDH